MMEIALSLVEKMLKIRVELETILQNWRKAWLEMIQELEHSCGIWNFVGKGTTEIKEEQWQEI